MNGMISEIQLRRSMVPDELLKVGLHDAMVKAHIDSFAHGNFHELQDMLINLSLVLAKEKKHYFDQALRLTAILPPQPIFVGASEPATATN